MSEAANLPIEKRDSPAVMLVFLGIAAADLVRQNLDGLVVSGLLFFLLFSGPPRFTLTEEGAISTRFDLALVFQIIVFLFVGIFLVWKKVKIDFSPIQILALILILVFALSAVRSFYPAYTFFRAYQTAVLFFFSAFFIERFGVAKHLRLMMWAAFFNGSLIVLWLLIDSRMVLNVELTGFPRLRGAGVTTTAEVGSLFFALVLSQCVRWRRLLLIFAIILVFFSLGRAAWLCAATIALVAAIWKPQIWSVRWCRIGVITAFLLSLTVNVSGFAERFRQTEGLTDLTGRPLLWAYVVDDVWTNSKWIGRGHSAGSHTLASDFDPELGSTHSLYMDAFAGSGLIGAAITILLAAAVIRGCWRASRVSRSAEVFAVFALALVVLGLGLVSGANIDVGPFAFAYWALPSLVSGFLTSNTNSMRGLPVPSRLLGS